VSTGELTNENGTKGRDNEFVGERLFPESFQLRLWRRKKMVDDGGRRNGVGDRFKKVNVVSSH
jgi:hypothetical protein